jgi:gamma-glutamylputrescine oxidase
MPTMENAEIAAARYGYPHVQIHGSDETAGAARLEILSLPASRHRHRPYPSDEAHRRARQAAAEAGASLHETTQAQRSAQSAGQDRGHRDGKWRRSPRPGTDRLQRAISTIWSRRRRAHVMPIRSFIGATEPLDPLPTVLPGNGESVADSAASSCAISAKAATGACCSAAARPIRPITRRDITQHIRRQIAEIYPQLGVEINPCLGRLGRHHHATQPFVREVMPGVTSIGGYSGHGVMLSNYLRPALCGSRARRCGPGSPVRSS